MKVARWLILLVAYTANAQEGTPSIAEKTAEMERLEGFFDIYWDDETGKLYWEIDKFDAEFLYSVSLSSGLGSNPVGLDRGQLGGAYVLEAMRVGPRVLLMEPNYGYRARSDNPGRGSRRAGRLRTFGALGLRSRGRDGRKRARRRHRLLPPRTRTAPRDESSVRAKGATRSTEAAASSTCRGRKHFRRTRRSRPY